MGAHRDGWKAFEDGQYYGPGLDRPSGFGEGYYAARGLKEYQDMLARNQASMAEIWAYKPPTQEPSFPSHGFSHGPSLQEHAAAEEARRALEAKRQAARELERTAWDASENQRYRTERNTFEWRLEQWDSADRIYQEQRRPWQAAWDYHLGYREAAGARAKSRRSDASTRRFFGTLAAGAVCLIVVVLCVAATGWLLASTFVRWLHGIGLGRTFLQWGDRCREETHAWGQRFVDRWRRVLQDARHQPTTGRRVGNYATAGVLCLLDTLRLATLCLVAVSVRVGLAVTGYLLGPEPRPGDYWQPTWERIAEIWASETFAGPWSEVTDPVERECASLNAEADEADADWRFHNTALHELNQRLPAINDLHPGDRPMEPQRPRPFAG